MNYHMGSPLNTGGYKTSVRGRMLKLPEGQALNNSIRLFSRTVLVCVACMVWRVENALADKPVDPPPTVDPVANEAFEGREIEGRISDRFEIYNPHSLEHLETVKALGFDQVVLDWPNLHADATRLGLDVVIANWWTKDTKAQDIDERMNFFKEVDASRLAAVSMMDEPERYAPDTPFSYY